MRRTITNDPIEDAMFFIEWTPESLRSTRKSLGVTQKDIAKVMQVSPTTILNIEKSDGYGAYRPLVILYGVVLERIYAHMNGYVPSFRRLGFGEQISFEELMEYL